MAIASTGVPAYAAQNDFGPSNPFYAESTLPFHAPPFDKIKDSDYQPAIEAGMAQQRDEMKGIAENPAPPTFENTIVAMEKTGRLFDRAMSAFGAVTGANLNPELQKVQQIEAPKLAAHADAIFLDPKLFQRVKTIYEQRDSLKLDPESYRLVDYYYKKFVHSGANLSDADKVALKKLNEEESSLSQAFTTKLLAATKDGALVTSDKNALAGLTDAQIAAAAQAAKGRKLEGYVIPLQNTTQQPDLAVLKQRATRQAIFENSWNRAERGGANDTREIVARLAELRAEKAQLYGITFKERTDIPVYQPDVRVFEVSDSNGKPMALFYGDYFKRDNKNGGAWMDSLVGQSKLLGTLPVVFNVANFPKPAPGQPALISFTDVTTMFHEFGHALHGMFADTMYPTLSGTAVPRDFVEFPSQFNEHWALYPAIFNHYARHYQTGAPMPADLASKIKETRVFNQGYALTEVVAAAELDMKWHTLPPGTPLQKPDQFETKALQETHLALSYVPPRYRSSYFAHIWGGGYSAGYYAYLWSEMVDHDAFAWFEEHGGLTRSNGDRFRKMVLSRGNTEDLAKMYAAWAGREPSIEPMLKYRGILPSDSHVPPADSRVPPSDSRKQ